MSKKPKIIFWDIETSLMTVTSFSLRPDFIPHDGIISDWSILCGAWKELGESKTQVVAVEKAGNDKGVCRKLRKVLADADLIVHHNGDKFDLRKLNARLIYHRLEPLPAIPTVDTLKVARKEFAFTSNRLDYLGKHLLGEGKIHTSPDLWMRVLKNDKSAIKEMATYNAGDVELLEKIYLTLRPYMKKHPQLGLLDGGTKTDCPKCNSINVKKYRIRLNAGGTRVQQYQCQDCGGYHQGTYKEPK